MSLNSSKAIGYVHGEWGGNGSLPYITHKSNFIWVKGLNVKSKTKRKNKRLYLNELKIRKNFLRCRNNNP